MTDGGLRTSGGARRSRLRQMTWTGPFWRHVLVATAATAAALVAALWVAICAAAPELIWQGLRIAAGHLTRADLVEALLLGVILAFFVEPLMRRAQDLLRHGRIHSEPAPGHPLFAASLSLSFALVAVGVHDALMTLVNKSDGGLLAAIRLTAAWAIVPGTVTFAWLTARRRRLALLTGTLAALSGGIVCWLFSWSGPAIFDSVVPSLAILGFGYPRATTGAGRTALMRCIRVVVTTGAVWTVLAVTIDLLMRRWHGGVWQIYRPGEAWIDVRFYIGWGIGLLLAPAPRDVSASQGQVADYRVTAGPR
jgi:hypothetical protein